MNFYCWFLELPWDEPTKTNKEYCDWLRNNVNRTPWIKMDSQSLGWYTIQCFLFFFFRWRGGGGIVTTEWDDIITKHGCSHVCVAHIVGLWYERIFQRGRKGSHEGSTVCSPDIITDLSNIEDAWYACSHWSIGVHSDERV